MRACPLLETSSPFPQWTSFKHHPANNSLYLSSTLLRAPRTLLTRDCRRYRYPMSFAGPPLGRRHNLFLGSLASYNAGLTEDFVASYTSFILLSVRFRNVRSCFPFCACFSRFRQAPFSTHPSSFGIDISIYVDNLLLPTSLYIPSSSSSSLDTRFCSVTIGFSDTPIATTHVLFFFLSFIRMVAWIHTTLRMQELRLFRRIFGADSLSSLLRSTPFCVCVFNSPNCSLSGPATE